MPRVKTQVNPMAEFSTSTGAGGQGVLGLGLPLAEGVVAPTGPVRPAGDGVGDGRVGAGGGCGAGGCASPGLGEPVEPVVLEALGLKSSPVRTEQFFNINAITPDSISPLLSHKFVIVENNMCTLPTSADTVNLVGDLMSQEMIVTK